MGLLCRAAVGSLGPSAAPGLLRPPAMLLGQGGAPGPPAPAGSEAAAVPRPVLSPATSCRGLRNRPGWLLGWGMGNVGGVFYLFLALATIFWFVGVLCPSGFP